MKIITCDQAAKLVKDKDMLGITGSGGCGSPENLLIALRERYEKENHPQSIGVTCGIAPGDLTENNVGINNLAVKGLTGLAICGHLGRGKLFGEAAGRGDFPAYTIPLGVYGHLLRAISGHKKGVLTKVGLHTFCDPRLEGCKANQNTHDDIVELVQIDGEEQLLYKSYPINIAFIKATYADEDGNVTLSHEPIIGEQVELASATHNSGGIVICEVEKIVPKGSIKPKEVDIFKKMVDYVVVTKQNEALGDYNFPIYRPDLIGEEKIEPQSMPPMPLNNRKICGRRASLELKKDDIVNLGIGMPDSVGLIAAEEGFSEDITISIETGVFGGIPVYGLSFGAASNPISLYSTTNMFDLYDGGIIDVAVLGLAELDPSGNVNVSKLGSRMAGPGGFINITQNSKKIIFIGTFTGGGLEEKIENGKVIIEKEGNYTKFKKQIAQITFSAKYANEYKQDVLYVTERAVFKLTNDGPELIEIAPGIDIQKDILANMEFTPKISPNLKEMDSKIFLDEKMNLILK